MEEEKWWNSNWNEELSIIALAGIAIIALFFSDKLGNEIPLSIGSGLVGYLKGKQNGVNK